MMVAKLGLVVALFGVVGCGSDPQLSSVAAADLQERAARLRTAVDAEDTHAAARRLLALEEAVSRWLEAGELSEVRAARILSASTAIALRLDAIAEANPTPTPTVTVVVTETATPSPSETEDPDDWDDGKGNGKGHGKDEDD